MVFRSGHKSLLSCPLAKLDSDEIKTVELICKHCCEILKFSIKCVAS